MSITPTLRVAIATVLTSFCLLLVSLTFTDQGSATVGEVTIGDIESMFTASGECRHHYKARDGKRWYLSRKKKILVVGQSSKTVISQASSSSSELSDVEETIKAETIDVLSREFGFSSSQADHSFKEFLDNGWKQLKSRCKTYSSSSSMNDFLELVDLFISVGGIEREGSKTAYLAKALLTAKKETAVAHYILTASFNQRVDMKRFSSVAKFLRYVSEQHRKRPGKGISKSLAKKLLKKGPNKEITFSPPTFVNRTLADIRKTLGRNAIYSRKGLYLLDKGKRRAYFIKGSSSVPGSDLRVYSSDLELLLESLGKSGYSVSQLEKIVFSRHIFDDSSMYLRF